MGEQIVSFHLLLGRIQRSSLVRNLKKSPGASTQGQGYSVVQVRQPSVTYRVRKCHRHKKYLCLLCVNSLPLRYVEERKVRSLLLQSQSRRSQHVNGQKDEKEGTSEKGGNVK